MGRVNDFLLLTVAFRDCVNSLVSTITGLSDRHNFCSPALIKFAECLKLHRATDSMDF
jgi:hypothetical protein